MVEHCGPRQRVSKFDLSNQINMAPVIHST